MSALLVTADLMTISQALGAAARANVVLESAPHDKAVQVAESSKPLLIAIDLQCQITNLEKLIANLREASSDAVLVAFGPHVQEALLTAALKAGCDQVITRGQFHRNFEALLTEHTSGD